MNEKQIKFTPKYKSKYNCMNKEEKEVKHGEFVPKFKCKNTYPYIKNAKFDATKIGK